MNFKDLMVMKVHYQGNEMTLILQWKLPNEENLDEKLHETDVLNIKIYFNRLYWSQFWGHLEEQTQYIREKIEKLLLFLDKTWKINNKLFFCFGVLEIPALLR